ncbi:hypothetical protein LPJ59_000258 [Coemansia sp. RSA 2399]|nr:hypothetical protein LPJ59_000258 [Coemansia sp. RSA 2399]
MMLAIAAAKHLQPGAPGVQNINVVSHIAKATFQTHSSQGRQLHGRGKWASRLLDYLRNGVGKIIGRASSGATSTGHVFSKTAAGRLHAAMPRGPAWFSRLSRFAPKSIKNSYVRSLSQRLSKQFLGWQGAARFTGQRLDAGRLAFGGGGKWSPYMKHFVSSLRGISAKGSATSARAIFAQMQRQAIACTATQERRDLSTVFGDTRVKLVASMESTGAKSAAKSLAGRHRNANRQKLLASAVDSAGKANADGQELHPVAKAAQKASVPMERCVTVTVPYTLPAPGVLAGAQDPSSEDVFKALAGLQQAQQRHDLLLSRLVERLSASGWDIQYKQLDRPAISLQIGLPPSTGITTVNACEALLCDWGFDLSLFAATVRNPEKPIAAGGPKTFVGSSARTGSNIDSYSSSEDIDSRLFSLIVDEVVDPDEAYREDVQDFLELLDQMPQLSRHPETTLM